MARRDPAMRLWPKLPTTGIWLHYRAKLIRLRRMRAAYGRRRR